MPITYPHRDNLSAWAHAHCDGAERRGGKGLVLELCAVYVSSLARWRSGGGIAVLLARWRGGASAGDVLVGV